MERAHGGAMLEGIAAVRSRIERWRSTRPGRGPMPEDLWEEAVALAREHGLYRIARALPVDYGALKKRLERGGNAEPAGFVEVDASRLLGAPEPVSAGAVVELSAGDGARLTVRLAAGEAVDLVGLARAFWGRGA